jgi:hypothetical protein
MDYNKASFKTEDFARKRALAVYEIALIFVNLKEQEMAIQFFPSVISELSGDSKCKKQAELAQNKVSKYWQRNTE